LHGAKYGQNDKQCKLELERVVIN